MASFPHPASSSAMRSERRDTIEAVKTAAADFLYAALANPSLKATEVERAQLRAAMHLLNVDIPALPLSPVPEDFEDLSRSLVRIADAIDPLLYEIGQDARSNAVSIKTIDVEEYFHRPLFGAIDGNATGCLENEAEQLREYEAEATS